MMDVLKGYRLRAGQSFARAMMALVVAVAMLASVPDTGHAAGAFRTQNFTYGMVYVGYSF